MSSIYVKEAIYTNEEYKEKLRELLLNIDDLEIIRSIYTYAKQKQYKLADYHASNSDYGDMIIEMVGKIRNKRFIEMIYGFTKGIYDEEKAGKF